MTLPGYQSLLGVDPDRASVVRAEYCTLDERNIALHCVKNFAIAGQAKPSKASLRTSVAYQKVGRALQNKPVLFARSAINGSRPSGGPRILRRQVFQVSDFHDRRVPGSDYPYGM